jgi:hypothetical protein
LVWNKKPAGNRGVQVGSGHGVLSGIIV